MCVCVCVCVHVCNERSEVITDPKSNTGSSSSSQATGGVLLKAHATRLAIGKSLPSLLDKIEMEL